ncbi:pyridoxal phosphate-dependent decarboxylase family protein [Bacillus thuringiensis]|nr:pyridoxal-dependent decarboxylase [Bacillus thuringiensis]
MNMNLKNLFPSENGNVESRNVMLDLVEQLLTGLDQQKNPNTAILGEEKEKNELFYTEIINSINIPQNGIPTEKMVEELLDLSQGHPFANRNYLANAIPLSSIPGLLGQLTMALLNSNSIWDVYGPAATEAEVKVTAMLSKLIGYNPEKSLGYTTWGGQGAVFNSLRLAIAKKFPNSNKEGVPNNLYCFASELAHYSTLKSIEATGIGSDHLIRIKANKDNSMDINDLRHQLQKVIKNGGIPIFVVATTGTTDSFGIDDVSTVKEACVEVEKEHGLSSIHIHADSAMGGMFSFFNNYDFQSNPLKFEKDVLSEIHNISNKMRNLHFADTVCFDFHKLGQTPYITSFYLAKNAEDFKYLDLESDETPYIGHRGFGNYHTGYTLECSRSGSSIPIYSALQTFGIEGYQLLLGHFVRCNLEFRKELLGVFENVGITNEQNGGPIITFRFYEKHNLWKDELNGQLTSQEIEKINHLNSGFTDYLGQYRHDVFFGDTTKQCYVNVRNTDERLPISVIKAFFISPHLEIEHIKNLVQFLKDKWDEYMELQKRNEEKVLMPV